MRACGRRRASTQRITSTKARRANDAVRRMHHVWSGPSQLSASRCESTPRRTLRRGADPLLEQARGDQSETHSIQRLPVRLNADHGLCILEVVRRIPTSETGPGACGELFARQNRRRRDDATSEFESVSSLSCSLPAGEPVKGANEPRLRDAGLVHPRPGHLRPPGLGSNWHGRAGGTLDQGTCLEKGRRNHRCHHGVRCQPQGARDPEPDRLVRPHPWNDLRLGDEGR